MTLPPNLPWVRYWVREGAAYGIHEGFQPPIDERNRKYCPDYPRTMESLQDVPVLILLGEAGAGKSWAMNQAYDACTTDVPAFLDLSSIGSEDRLGDRLANELRPLNDGASLALYLDSLDECRLEIRQATNVILDALRQHASSINRLKIRIACRSTAWPDTFATTLRGLWAESKNGIQTWWLCPLTAEDAREAVLTAELDADAFMNEVQSRALESLACRPKTLEHMISSWHNNGSLPGNRQTLYESALGYLCEETLERAEKGHDGKLTSGQRLLFAMRIATASLLCNRDKIVLPGRGAITFDGCLTIDDLVCDQFLTDSGLISKENILEVLKIAGLFSRADEGRVRFAHRSDAEFLCARFLSQLNLTEGQLRPLLTNAKDGRLVPQLSGMVSFLAESDESIRRWLISEAPVAVLDSECPLTDAERAHLLEELTQYVESGGDEASIPGRRLSRLEYPKAANVLVDMIGDESRPAGVRRLAVRVIDACQLTSHVFPALRALFAQTDTPNWFREALTRRIADLAKGGHEESIKLLRPYAVDQLDDDPQDQIKGMTLDALWPSHISADELFKSLTVARDPHLFGAYFSFRLRLKAKLSAAALPAALSWVATQNHQHQREDLQQIQLCDAIMQAAWDDLEAPGVLRAFSYAALSRLQQHESMFNQSRRTDIGDLLDDVEKRHSLILTSLQSNPDEHLLNLMAWDWLRESDVAWLVERMTQSSATDHAHIAQLLAYRVQISGPSVARELLVRHSDPDSQDCIPALSAALWEMLTASGQQRQDQITEEAEKKSAQRPQLADSRKLRIQRAGRHIQDGELDAWIYVVWALTGRIGDGPWMHDTKIVGSEGWNILGETQRQQLPKLALAYLESNEPSKDFLGKSASFTHQLHKFRPTFV